MRHKKFEDLSKDEMVMISIMLDIPDVLALCQTKKEISRKICDNDDFWIQKLTHDYDASYDTENSLDPKNFYFIYVFKNKIGLHESVSNIAKVSDSNLTRRYLTELPKEISYLSSIIKLLLLNGNQLTELPKEIGDLSKLIGFDLSNNKLKKLPKEIGNLSQLRKLWLDHNKLKKLPKEIGYLSQLKEFRLDHNQLEEIPKEIGNLLQLEELRLDHNKLTKDQILEIKKMLPNTIYS